MFASLRSPRFVFALLAVASAAFAGCGSSDSAASVSGVVTLNGKPLPGKVLLSFVGTDNVPRSTETDDAGRFTVSGLPAGEVAVMVSEASAPAPVSRQAEGARPAPRTKAARGAVPPEYADAGRPLLRYTLAAGDNALAVELKSPAPGGSAKPGK
jgi:hypothetical protein